MKFIRRALVAVAAAAGLSLAAGVAFARSDDAASKRGASGDAAGAVDGG